MLSYFPAAASFNLGGIFGPPGGGRLSHSGAAALYFAWRTANEIYNAASELLRRPWPGPLLGAYVIPVMGGYVYSFADGLGIDLAGGATAEEEGGPPVRIY